MMTLEEAIRILQKEVDLDWFPNEKTEALKLAISALRPVSWEQVEQVWKGEWTGNFNAHCSRCDTFSTMAYIGQGRNFCPACGAPMTDEAVQMVMERLEALYEAT